MDVETWGRLMDNAIGMVEQPDKFPPSVAASHLEDVKRDGLALMRSAPAADPNAKLEALRKWLVDLSLVGREAWWVRRAMRDRIDRMLAEDAPAPEATISIHGGDMEDRIEIDNLKQEIADRDAKIAELERQREAIKRCLKVSDSLYALLIEEGPNDSL